MYLLKKNNKWVINCACYFKAKKKKLNTTNLMVYLEIYIYLPIKSLTIFCEKDLSSGLISIISASSFQRFKINHHHLYKLVSVNGLVCLHCKTVDRNIRGIQKKKNFLL